MREWGLFNPVKKWLLRHPRAAPQYLEGGQQGDKSQVLHSGMQQEDKTWWPEAENGEIQNGYKEKKKNDGEDNYPLDIFKT